MSSPASIAKHPIHPMLVVFPLGLLNFSLDADLIHLANRDPAWKEVATKTMLGGVVGALAAAVPGFIDYLTLKGKPKKIGTAHMALNLATAGIFAYNFSRRMKSPDAPAPIWLSILGAAGLAVSGWLGGQLVYVHGAAVEKESPEEQKKEISGSAGGIH